MILFRKAKAEELDVVGGFLTTPDELFFFFPKAVFPLTSDQLMPNFLTRKGNTVIIAENRVVGFANFISVSEGGAATIGNVAIDPDLRGRGLGKELINHMEASAKTEYGVKQVLIPCFSTNTAGLHFYHKLGYAPYSGEPRVDQNGNPVYLIYFAKSI